MAQHGTAWHGTSPFMSFCAILVQSRNQLPTVAQSLSVKHEDFENRHLLDLLCLVDLETLEPMAASCSQHSVYGCLWYVTLLHGLEGVGKVRNPRHLSHSPLWLRFRLQKHTIYMIHYDTISFVLCMMYNALTSMRTADFLTFMVGFQSWPWANHRNSQPVVLEV